VKQELFTDHPSGSRGNLANPSSPGKLSLNRRARVLRFVHGHMCYTDLTDELSAFSCMCSFTVFFVHRCVDGSSVIFISSSVFI